MVILCWENWSKYSLRGGIKEQSYGAPYCKTCVNGSNPLNYVLCFTLWKDVILMQLKNS